MGFFIDSAIVYIKCALYLPDVHFLKFLDSSEEKKFFHVFSRTATREIFRRAFLRLRFT